MTVEAPPFPTGNAKKDAENTRDYLLRLSTMLNNMEQEIFELKRLLSEGGSNSNGS